MSGLPSLFDNILLGFEVALSTVNLLYCLFGVFVGMLLGVIPGIGVLAGISLIYPITYYLEPVTAIIMLAGVYYGTAYGGSIASILLNLPGTPVNAVACLDGYPMSKQGRAGVALTVTALGSFGGATIGIILMMLFSPFIAEYALEFGSPEYFALILLGLISASTLSNGAPVKGMAMSIIGIIFGGIGTDVYTGVYRFTFDLVGLIDGISIIAVAIGVFGVSEVISSIRNTEGSGFNHQDITFRSMLPTKDDLRRSWKPMLRGAGVGSFFGALPGTGGMIAAFMAYALEKRIAKDSSRFGKGAIEGVVAPETANNAADQTAFIPTMTLGIPGSVTMAIMLGVLMIHGITPGPRLIFDRPDMFWGLVMSFWIGNLLLLIINIPMIGIWVRLLSIPYHLLYPAVLVFVCIGVYSVNNSAFDIWPVVGFAAFGYLMGNMGFPLAPLILGFVLGPLMEEHFRRAMLLSGGDFGTLVGTPIALTVMIMVAMLLAWTVVTMVRDRRRKSA